MLRVDGFVLRVRCVGGVRRYLPGMLRDAWKAKGKEDRLPGYLVDRLLGIENGLVLVVVISSEKPKIPVCLSCANHKWKKRVE